MKVVNTNGKKTWCGSNNSLALHLSFDKTEDKKRIKTGIYSAVVPIKQQEACTWLIIRSEMSKLCKITKAVVSKQNILWLYIISPPPPQKIAFLFGTFY